MYRDAMLNVIKDWGCESEAVDIAYEAWATMLSHTTTKSTAKEVADEMKKAIDELRSEDDFEDEYGWMGPYNVRYHYEMYDVASAMVKYFRELYINKAEDNVIPF